MKTKKADFITITTYLLFLLLLFNEPLLANKFETIGGGVQGSSRLKIEYLRVISYAVGGFFFIAGILAIILKKQNAATLNYTMWKSSSVLFFILATAAVAAGYFMS
jgi:hypothetical protein